MAWRAWASCFSRKNRAMASCALSQRPRACTSLSPQTPVMLNWSSTWPARSATAMRISPRTLALSPFSVTLAQLLPPLPVVRHLLLHCVVCYRDLEGRCQVLRLGGEDEQ